MAPTWTLTCEHAEAWLQRLEPDTVDALIADPPYCSGGRSATTRRSGTANAKYSNDASRYPEFLGDSRDQRSWIQWCSWWLALGFNAMKTGAVVAVFADWRQLPAMSDAIQMAGFVWRGIIAWDKTGAGDSRPASPDEVTEFNVRQHRFQHPGESRFRGSGSLFSVELLR